MRDLWSDLIAEEDPRLSWPEHELIRQFGRNLDGPRKEVLNG